MPRRRAGAARAVLVASADRAEWATVPYGLRPPAAKMWGERGRVSDNRLRPRGQHVKVLIAHGDAASRDRLRRITEDDGALGLVVTESGRGEDAFALLTGDGAPELALVDWELPGLGGPEVCRLVRARRRADAPYIILLTPGEEQAGEAFAAGADDCLAAGASGHELQARIFAARRFTARRRACH